MSAFYYITALFTSDLICNNLLHAINLQSKAPNIHLY